MVLTGRRPGQTPDMTALREVVSPRLLWGQFSLAKIRFDFNKPMDLLK